MFQTCGISFPSIPLFPVQSPVVEVLPPRCFSIRCLLLLLLDHGCVVGGDFCHTVQSRFGGEERRRKKLWRDRWSGTVADDQGKCRQKFLGGTGAKEGNQVLERASHLRHCGTSPFGSPSSVLDERFMCLMSSGRVDQSSLRGRMGSGG